MRLSIACWLIATAVTLVACGRRSAVFEIPRGFVGWVTVRYEAESCVSQNGSAWTSVIKVEPDGIACSATWSGRGLTYERFFYIDGDGHRVRELVSTGWGEGGEIWAESRSPDDKKIHFFVGTEQAFKDAKIGAPMADRLREGRPD